MGPFGKTQDRPNWRPAFDGNKYERMFEIEHARRAETREACRKVLAERQEKTSPKLSEWREKFAVEMKEFEKGLARVRVTDDELRRMRESSAGLCVTKEKLGVSLSIRFSEPLFLHDPERMESQVLFAVAGGRKSALVFSLVSLGVFEPLFTVNSQLLFAFGNFLYEDRPWKNLFDMMVRAMNHAVYRIARERD